MKQYLMHKDIIVAEVDSFRRLQKVIESTEMPVGTYSENKVLSERLFDNWLHDRIIPSNRQDKKRIEDILNMSVNDAFLESLGVSLTDCYWFKPENSPLLWKAVNFHDNGFSQDFSNAFLYDKQMQLSNFDIPDLTTDGALKKVWISINEIPTLIKSGKTTLTDRNLLSANEVCAYEIANIMDINHAQYYPININNNIYCACPCFINTSDFETITLLQIQHQNHKYMKEGIRNYFAEIGSAKKFDELLFLDAFIYNYDRHEKNIIFIQNTITKEIIFAPIIDSGSSLAATAGEDLKPLSISRKEQFAYIWAHDKELFSRVDYSTICNIIKRNYEIFGISEQLFEDAKRVVDDGIKMIEKVKEKQYYYEER